MYFYALKYLKMKKLYSPFFLRAAFVVLFMLSFVRGWGQISNYTFSQSNGAYTPITGGTISASGASLDDTIVSITLPTAFNYNGTSVTTVGFSPNGYLILGATTLSNSPYVPISSTSTATGIISALGMDLVSRATTSEQRWQQMDNEIIFQWKEFKRYDQTPFTNEVISFQIRLNTVTGSINIIYDGSTSVNASTSRIPQVGLRGNINTDFNARRLTTSVPDSSPAWNDTAAATNNAYNLRFTSTVTAAFPTSGLTYIWTPIACSGVPTGLNATAITSNSATIGWTAPSPAPASGYEYYYATTNTAPVAGTSPSGTTAAGIMTANLTLLNPSTTYYWWVRSNCSASDKSTWVSGGSFTTACGSVTTLPHIEGFDAVANPSCWSTALLSGSTNWLPDD